MSSEGQDVFEEVLELVSYFTYFSLEARPQQQIGFWSLLII